MPCTVLVTGASGFLGQHVVKTLHEKAADFVTYLVLFDKDTFVQKLGTYISTIIHYGKIAQLIFPPKITPC